MPLDSAHVVTQGSPGVCQAGIICFHVLTYSAASL